jgi:CRP-like cAMP-binding protein
LGWLDMCPCFLKTNVPGVFVTERGAQWLDQVRASAVDGGSVTIELVQSIPGAILHTAAQMTDREEVMNLLRKVPLFADLKDKDKICIEETEEWWLPAGKMLVEEGQQPEHFFVLLEGEISFWKKHADQDIVVGRGRPGAFFGEVPLLLGTPNRLSGRAERDSRLIVFPEEAFWNLLRLCPAISSEIFRTMATRLRNIEGSARQQEKLEALGTMSAGLAHELNNPSAAAQRIAVHLGEVIETIQSVAHRLHHALEHEHWDRLIALVGEILKNPSAGKHHHSSGQSDLEEALTAWLREGGVSDAWKIAPVLVGAGLDRSALVSLREDLPKNAFGFRLRANAPEGQKRFSISISGPSRAESVFQWDN